MSEDRIRLLQEKGFSFWGTVTASVSHELNNVISIIREYSGLLEDLASSAEMGQSIENEKLVRISERIVCQVRRGKGITSRLNRFAHSVDEPLSNCSLNQVMEDVVELARRFSDLKAVHLTSAFPEKAVAVTTNPFQLYQAVFTSIQLALDTAAKEDTVGVSFQQNGAGVEIRVESPRVCSPDSTDSRWSYLKTLVEELGGSVEVGVPDTEKAAILLWIPLALAPDGDSREVRST